MRGGRWCYVMQMMFELPPEISALDDLAKMKAAYELIEREPGYLRKRWESEHWKVYEVMLPHPLLIEGDGADSTVFRPCGIVAGEVLATQGRRLFAPTVPTTGSLRLAAPRRRRRTPSVLPAGSLRLYFPALPFLPLPELLETPFCPEILVGDDLHADFFGE